MKKNKQLLALLLAIVVFAVSLPLSLFTSAEDFISENLLQTHLASGKGILQSVNNGTVSYNDRFNGNGAAAIAIDGDINNYKDVYGCLDWTGNEHYVGIEYELDSVYFADKLNIYSGDTGLVDVYKVYASTTLKSLYEEESLVAEDISCDGPASKVVIGKNIKYISIICTGYNGNQRVREFELWGSKSDEDIFVSENILASTTVSFKGINMSVNDNSSYYYNERFFEAYKGREEELANGMIDGNKINHYDIWGGMGWEGNPHYVGVEIMLDDIYFIDYLALTSGFAENPDKVRIYASSTLDDLYKSGSIIADNLEIKGNEAVIELNNRAKYITIFYACETGRIKEIEAWTGKDTLDTLKDSKKVLTIGNSFSENASEYAVDIAKNQGYGLSFGYLKQPSCTIDMHCDNAKANKGAYSFTVVDDSGRNVIKKSGATIKEALKHTDWDIVVLQQASTASADINTYKRLGELIDYVKSVAPNAQIMLHGTWSWATMTGAKSNDIIANYYLMSTIHGLTVIPSGTVFESVRSFYNDRKYLTEADNQHANEIGKYASGAAYVATIFGLNIEANSFGDDLDVFKDYDMAQLRAIISDTLYAYNAGSFSDALFEAIENAYNKYYNLTEWVKEPANSENLLKNATATKILAPGGDFRGAKEQDYRFMDGADEADIKGLTDSDKTKHFDAYGFPENDLPGVLYDLGKYYDLSHIHGFAGIFGSTEYVNNGYRVYASDTLSDLYKQKSLVFQYENAEDFTNEFGADINLKKVRYIAFFLTSSSDSQWRIREFSAFGKLSSDQSVIVERTSIIEGIDAEYYGVATDNLADPVYRGASDFINSLTDGQRNSVEFWGGAEVESSKFVFIYNLYANYDLSGVDIYAFADSIEEDSGIHKGIKSAQVYASRKFADLFSGEPLTLKDGYENPAVADEESYFSADAKSDWKQARYIAYVFTIGDSRYGACRLEELKAFGTLSAVQDEEEEEEQLPQYIDVTADDVTVRIFRESNTDDLRKLEAQLSVDADESKNVLDKVAQLLGGYSAKTLYDIEITDASGTVISTGNRHLRISLPDPVGDEEYKIACVDKKDAEIIASGRLSSYYTVETSTLRDYAIVSGSANQAAGDRGSFDLAKVLWISVIALGCLAGAGIGLMIIVLRRSRAKEK